ncbi:hypothetical protein HanIR_Chr15g0780701 [Helianthus annuus]|nr:hypothetical protein HanIR_Chr15g0780701 [Helianthus annuus]
MFGWVIESDIDRHHSRVCSFNKNIKKIKKKRMFKVFFIKKIYIKKKKNKRSRDLFLAANYLSWI